jgi:hypothetical protein
VVQPINTIHSDADIRIAQRTKAARLAVGLMAAPLASTNIQEAPDAGMFPEAMIARREQPPCVSA